MLPIGAPAIPMAMRLPRQPLLGFLVQTIASCLWRPYPSLSDVVLYMVRCMILYALRFSLPCARLRCCRDA